MNVKISLNLPFRLMCHVMLSKLQINFLTTCSVVLTPFDHVKIKIKTLLGAVKYIFSVDGIYLLSIDKYISLCHHDNRTKINYKICEQHRIAFHIVTIDTFQTLDDERQHFSAFSFHKGRFLVKKQF